MKKTDFNYVLKNFIAPIVVLLAIIIILGNLHLATPAAILTVGLFVFLCMITSIASSKMEKIALVTEKTFADKGFTYQHKFTAHNAIFYIDRGGNLGVIWKYNPTEFYLADLAGLTDVHSDDGKQLLGTSVVSCRFKLDGKPYRIYTLRVSGGQLAMSDSRVLEALSKADGLCEMLTEAKRSAIAKSSN